MASKAMQSLADLAPDESVALLLAMTECIAGAH
jgi:hypothetical protein